MKNCTTECNDRDIIFKDKRGRCKMRFENPNNAIVKKIRIDACVLNEGIRCDFLLIDHKNIEHYVELKGKQIAHASNQLEETIKKISLNPFKSAKYAFIVSTACPLTTTAVQLLKLSFKTKYNTKLIIKNVECKHTII